MKIVIEASPQELLELGVSTDAEMRTKVLRSITQQAAHDVANPAPAGGQGAQDDYRKWYEEAMAASNEAGYAGMDAASTINALSDELRVVSDELARAKQQGAASTRTDAEIVEQTEELAAKLMSWRWGQQPEFAGMEFRNSDNTKAQGCWTAACKIQELITGTDVENAVAEVDGVNPDFDQDDDAAHDDGQAQAHVAEHAVAAQEVASHEAPKAAPTHEQVQAAGAPRVSAGGRRIATVRQVGSSDAAANTVSAKPEVAVPAAPASSAPAPTAPVSRPVAGAGPVRRRVVGG